MSGITCGTTAGYRQHQRNRTTPCQSCRDAQAAYMRNYRHANGHNKARLVPDHIIQQHGIKVNT